MFQQARLRLTVWYLLIIMGISILFSAAFYSVATREVGGIIARMQYARHDVYNMQRVSPPMLAQRIADLEASKQRLLFSLIFLNGIIFVVAGGGGYFLAGRTLIPIQEMVSQQNRFITDASHELRTPLTATRTAIEVALRDTSLTLSEAKKVMDGSLDDISSIQALSDNLLRLSQVENNQNTAVLGKASLSNAIDFAVKKVASLAKAKHIRIIQKTPKQYFVKGDEQSLQELCMIFLDNAIKYSPKESTITVSAERTDGHVLLTIKDMGIGVAKEDADHIFDRFYRAEKSRSKNKVQGYGLGLSIAKKIIEEHKGSVKVESTVGKGTLFTISLPVIS